MNKKENTIKLNQKRTLQNKNSTDHDLTGRPSTRAHPHPHPSPPRPGGPAPGGDTWAPNSHLQPPPCKDPADCLNAHLYIACCKSSLQLKKNNTNLRENVLNE